MDAGPASLIEMGQVAPGIQLVDQRQAIVVRMWGLDQKTVHAHLLPMQLLRRIDAAVPAADAYPRVAPQLPSAGPPGKMGAKKPPHAPCTMQVDFGVAGNSSFPSPRATSTYQGHLRPYDGGDSGPKARPCEFFLRIDSSHKIFWDILPAFWRLCNPWATSKARVMPEWFYSGVVHLSIQ
jgi:hypothetical protein